MKKRWLKKLQRFFQYPAERQITRRHELKLVLQKLKIREKKLRKMRATETLPSLQRKLDKQIKKLHKERKKGLKLLANLPP